MIKKVFIDSDVLLDVALARNPFFPASKTILAMAENNYIVGTISSNCIANMYYILRKAGGDTAARFFIGTVVSWLSVLAIDHQNVLASLQSPFTDFEDALQHQAAVNNQCEYIITRNIQDYTNSTITVMLPEEFIRLFN